MKLLFATEYYDPHGRGGSATSIRELGEALVAAGHQVSIVTPNWGAPPRERTLSGMQIVRFWMRDSLEAGQAASSRVFLSPRFHGAFAWAIAREARRMGADILHAQDKHAIVGTYLAGVALRRPTYATLRDVGVVCPITTCLLNRRFIPSDCGQRRMQHTCAPFFMDHYAHPGRLRTRLALAWRLADTRLKAYALRRMRRVIGLSAAHLHVCEAALGLERTAVVPNIFAPPRPLSGPTVTPLRPPMFLAVGRVTLGKGFPVLVSAAARVTGTLGPTGAQIFMAGEANGYALDRIRGSVRLLGHQGPTAMRWLYRQATAAVLPSLSPEASSRVPLEAAAERRPTIVSAAGGGPETVEHRVSGLVVPPGNDRALAEAMLELVADPAYTDKLGEQAHESMLARFGPATILPRLLAAYEAA